MRFRYKITIGGAYTYAANGIDLDGIIREGLGRGVKIEDIQVEVESR